MELQKSRQDYQKLQGSLAGMLERQRAVDMHVEHLKKSMRNLSGRKNSKNISGNLITVYNNAGINDNEQIKSSGFYYS